MVSYLVLALTIISSLTIWLGGEEGFQLQLLLQLDKGAVADGEYYRLWTVTLVHANQIHLLFNAFALWLAGPLVERLYGPWLFLLFYVLCAAAGSVASFVFGSPLPSVGASGAIFGLIGILFAASRTHHPILDQRGRSLIGQLGFLIVINLIFGFTFGSTIDNAAHIGGLLAGMWIGFLIAPTRVQTMKTQWQQPGTPVRTTASVVLPTVAVAGLVAVIVVGVLAGTEIRADLPPISALTTHVATLAGGGGP
jgi:rhomboid protease GluP